MNLQLILASVVVSAFVAGVVSLLVSERKIQIENITQERAKWRDKIRKQAVQVHHSASGMKIDKLKELRLEFSLNLNPLDDEDNPILDLISRLEKPEDTDEALREFSERLSLLLKHDWDRAKYEAKFWKYEAKFWKFRIEEPRRIPYGEFKEKQRKKARPILTN